MPHAAEPALAPPADPSSPRLARDLRSFLTELEVLENTLRSASPDAGARRRVLEVLTALRIARIAASECLAAAEGRRAS